MCVKYYSSKLLNTTAVPQNTCHGSIVTTTYNNLQLTASDNII